VTVPAYRDSEAQWTLADLFAKAAHPEQVSCGTRCHKVHICKAPQEKMQLMGYARVPAGLPSAAGPRGGCVAGGAARGCGADATGGGSALAGAGKHWLCFLYPAYLGWQTLPPAARQSSPGPPWFQTCAERLYLPAPFPWCFCCCRCGKWCCLPARPPGPPRRARWRSSCGRGRSSTCRHAP
jgi:hypothetical protein